MRSKLRVSRKAVAPGVMSIAVTRMTPTVAVDSPPIAFSSALPSSLVR